MSYYGYQPEQTKAQIRSTRGETIDLALPVTCLVGELRTFLIEQYGYDGNTRLLYNGLVADDNSYVCDYPFGSLMIATPADMQPSRQPLPPRQSGSLSQAPPAPQQPSRQHVGQAGVSPRNGAGGHHKNKSNDASPGEATRAGRGPAAANSGRGKNSARKSPRQAGGGGSTSTDTAPSRTAENVPPPPPPPPPESPPASTEPVESVSNANATPHAASGRSPQKSGARSPPSARASSQAAAGQLNGTPAAVDPSPAAPPAPTTTAEEENSHRQRVRFTVECHIPSLDRIIPVTVNGESSVVDLMQTVVAAAPELGGAARVVFRGKVLPQNPQAKLFDLGMRADTRVFIAAGAFVNPETITLLEIEADTAEIDQAMQQQLTDLRRKGYYEQLMRILFRTDGLQSLEGEWRQRRKNAVKHITTLQDALGVEQKPQ